MPDDSALGLRIFAGFTVKLKETVNYSLVFIFLMKKRLSKQKVKGRHLGSVIGGQ